LLRRGAPLAVLAALCACSPQAKTPQLDTGAVDAEARIQHEMVLRENVAKLDRLYRVAWNIRAQNAELCFDRQALSFGVNFLELDDYKAERRDVVKSVLGVHWRPTVFQLGPGGPAEAAGMRRGDVVVAVDNELVQHKKKIREAFNAARKKAAPVLVDVERDGELLEFTLTPAKLCGYPVSLRASSELNAFADGDNIFIYSGMLKFVKSDDELAAIMGHEMAHSTQNHVRDKTVNAIIGKVLIDLPTLLFLGVDTHLGERMGANIFSPQYEAEADYVGLYYTARAGYDIHNVADLWRRMSVENPGGITLVTTHPSHSQRFVGLTVDAAEIDKKRAEGLPLVPEMKDAPKKNATPAEAAPEMESIPETDPR
jgi:Putative Zn-dependent protease, contains TPR repeats